LLFSVFITIYLTAVFSHKLDNAAYNIFTIKRTIPQNMYDLPICTLKIIGRKMPWLSLSVGVKAFLFISNQLAKSEFCEPIPSV